MASLVSISALIGQGYNNAWFTRWQGIPCRYRLFIGARNTKKSYNIIGLEPVIKLISDSRRNILVVRNNYNVIRQSCFAQILSAINALGLAYDFESKTSPFEIRRKSTGQKIVFRGFNDPQSLQGLTFENGYFTDVYIEEAFEIASEEDFIKLDGTLRGRLPQGLQHQITFCMNPWDKSHWIYQKFFKGRMPEDAEYLEKHKYREVYDPQFTRGYGRGLYIHQSTYLINEFRDPEYGSDAQMLKKFAYEQYCTQFLGMWGQSGSLVYREWCRDRERLIMTKDQIMRTRFSKYAIGIDTGLSNGEGKRRSADDIRSATVMELVGLTQDGEKLVAIDEWYFTNQGRKIPVTQTEIIRSMVTTLSYWRTSKWLMHPDLFKFGQTNVFVDSASAGFQIDMQLETARQGMGPFFRYGPSTKMPIQSRVDFECVQMGWGTLNVSLDCQNLCREFTALHVDPKTGIRENTNDHAVNAFEYGIVPMMRYLNRWRQYGVHDSYDTVCKMEAQA